jgi:uncharacterized protein (TIGR02118 family)
MIKVSVMYPNRPDARFDHDYYRDKHMPMVAQLLGAACRRYSVDKGLGGGMPGQAAPFVAQCHLYFDSVEAFQATFAPHGKAIMADVPNYTDLQPQVQVSEVVVA